MDLAALHRQSAGNVPWAGYHWRGEGAGKDRNVILPMPAPFPLARLRSGYR